MALTAYSVLFAGNQGQAGLAVHLVEVLRLHREADVLALEPGIDAIGVMWTGGVAGLSGAVLAHHRFNLTEVDDHAHGRDQCGLEPLPPTL